MSSQQIRSELFVPQAIIPTVIESSPRGERAFDIYSLLLRERIVFLNTPINDRVANTIIAQLLFLEREDPDRDINLYITSPGGVIRSGLAIYGHDATDQSRCFDHLPGHGSQHGLLLAGRRRQGQALRPSQLHHPHPPGHGRGPRPGLGYRNRGPGDHQAGAPTEHNPRGEHGQPYDKVAQDSSRDFYLTAEDALEYGWIDEILGSKKKEE